MKKPTLAADLATFKQYEEYPFTWWQQNAVYIIFNVLIVLIALAWDLLS